MRQAAAAEQPLFISASRTAITAQRNANLMKQVLGADLLLSEYSFNEVCEVMECLTESDARLRVML
jgi:hypothetical protein